MDPTETLSRIRANIKSYYEDDDWTQGQGDEFIDDVLALDDWMGRGGFPPAQWVVHVAQGRPKRTEDGVVLQGVPHGNRTSYNKGCRCLRCTEANRAAGALHRLKKVASNG